MVYAHAMALAERGHQVSVVSPEFLSGGLLGWAMAQAIRLRDRLHGVQRSPYYQAPGVKTLIVPTIVDKHIPDSDVIIATGVQTAKWVRDLAATKGEKVYFVQSVETFVDPDATDTWNYPLAKISIADWITAEMEKRGHEVLGLVPNAIDPDEFALETPIEERGERVLALYHRHPVKEPNVLIEAIKEIRSTRPSVEFDVFCARPPSHALPEYVNVHIRPDIVTLRVLYNSASVLLHTSRIEGSPLVPMEAAVCGCAVVAAANQGVQQYLEDGNTMRMVPIGDSQTMARAALELLTDETERVRIARSALEKVTSFSWEKSTSTLESLLKSVVGK